MKCIAVGNRFHAHVRCYLVCVCILIWGLGISYVHTFPVCVHVFSYGNFVSLVHIISSGNWLVYPVLLVALSYERILSIPVSSTHNRRTSRYFSLIRLTSYSCYAAYVRYFYGPV